MNNKNEIKARDNIKVLIIYLITAGVFIFSLAFYYLNANFNISEFILLILSAYVSFKIIKDNNPEPYESINIAKWAFLAFAATIVFSLILIDYYSYFTLQVALLFMIFSFTSYFSGQRILLKLIIPFAVLFLLVPFYNNFYSIISYPIRLVCTKLTVTTLSFFGVDIFSESTIISIGEKKVAITAACSGLILLETLTWIGWIIVRYLYKSLYIRLFHFILILPIVIFVNTIRLIVLVMLFSVFGEVIIISPVHMWLGYIMIALASIIFYFSKNLYEEIHEENI